ncbi:glycine--tRNA ligase [Candidatus Kaiserbacteria bacterium CG10_big_fil_rev_8_21_14_0_10_49_17]|uniref:glycine--tRNA ligase n=1 Tax=Candidatus Kaiserbacteria bacterium CG10_big_fil_rev_8_21_14_0_10_49_17 TaxID=1974609 RepID=A0A2M6WDS0_9BACT|nr:MAG: glycine--tRNA ligase [Candidatus Kaiserbacteria bacterium CG10_big_fil_rev_8_21_14_0_10_49_17]
MNEKETMEKLVALSKRRGFIFQGSEIYGGLAGTWDYGPYGVALKNNVKNLWWKKFVDTRFDMFGVDAAILMNEKVWEASGHTGAGFTDPLIECANCKKRFREDHLAGAKCCPECGGVLGEARDFNLMFQTQVGSQGDTKSYLRPETAQGMFVNFKNILDTLHPQLPFGLAQIGKAFRNEIAPRDFIFRTREFEQMEIEYFVREEDWESAFTGWKAAMEEWMEEIGLPKEALHELEVPEEDRAHYSKRTIDFEFDFPFGRKELYGLAYRTDFDLKNHMEHSGVDLRYSDPATGEKFIPHVIEPTFGLDRTVLAVLVSAYTEDELDGEQRTVLKLAPSIAPVRVAVFPLLKNKPELVEKAKSVYSQLKAVFGNVSFDDNGNIGKRYRRQDEIGTPQCVTVDFETLEDNAVTVRDRDTGTQERVALVELQAYITNTAK